MTLETEAALSVRMPLVVLKSLIYRSSNTAESEASRSQSRFESPLLRLFHKIHTLDFETLESKVSIPSGVRLNAA